MERHSSIKYPFAGLRITVVALFCVASPCFQLISILLSDVARTEGLTNLKISHNHTSPIAVDALSKPDTRYPTSIGSGTYLGFRGEVPIHPRWWSPKMLRLNHRLPSNNCCHCSPRASYVCPPRKAQVVVIVTGGGLSLTNGLSPGGGALIGATTFKPYRSIVIRMVPELRKMRKRTSTSFCRSELGSSSWQCPASLAKRKMAATAGTPYVWTPIDPIIREPGATP